jgi:uncharacterized membrane protein YhaH (DUF805 family)
MDDPSSTNPYASPQAQLEPQAAASHNGLWWIFFSFQGRIPRRYYWGAYLGGMIPVVVAALTVILAFGEESDVTNLSILVIQLLVIWSTFALDAKRWHDRDKSAAWLLIRFIPVIGVLWVLIELGCLRGTHGPNRYGPDPT